MTSTPHQHYGPPTATRTRRVAVAALAALAVGAITMYPGFGGTAEAAESAPVGWAAMDGGTAGGSTRTTVRAASAAAFLAAIKSSTSQTVVLTANITISGMNAVASNKTIIGDGTGKTVRGGGLTIKGQTNVIIRNLVFDGWADDAINIESSSTNIWVDHNTFGKGYDGAVDIKRGSDYITVSWNKVNGHDKTMLLGHSDDNGSQDRGHLRVTYHHNWFNGAKQRLPRVRFGNPVHVYNNYYQNVGGYGVASTEGAGVLVEANYFEGTDDPFHRGEASSGPGGLVARSNYFVNSGRGSSGGSVANIPYSYRADQASSVKSIVTGGAGAGRLGSATSSTPVTSGNTPAPAATAPNGYPYCVNGRYIDPDGDGWGWQDDAFSCVVR